MHQPKSIDEVRLLKREELESIAVAVVSAADYYDLMDTLEETPDEDLIKIIIESGEVEL